MAVLTLKILKFENL